MLVAFRWIALGCFLLFAAGAWAADEYDTRHAAAGERTKALLALDKQIAGLEQQVHALRQIRDSLANDSSAPGSFRGSHRTEAAGEHSTRQLSVSGEQIYKGPRGGRYHYSSSGKKVYTKKTR